MTKTNLLNSEHEILIVELRNRERGTYIKDSNIIILLNGFIRLNNISEDLMSNTRTEEHDIVRVYNSKSTTFLSHEPSELLWERKEIISCQELLTGEAMVITDNSSEYNGKVIIKTYNTFVNVYNVTETWDLNCGLKGYKIDPGTKLTITTK